MPAVRLGKIHLRWCDGCNVPVLELASCSVCGEGTRQVSVTPPGDVRPAFPSDIASIRELVDAQFGDGCGRGALPDGRIVLLNKAPDLDRMDEVIMDGEVVGAVRFDLKLGEKFLPRPSSAVRMQSLVARSWVEVDDGAVDAVRTRKASTLAVGVTDCDRGIAAGDDVVVLDRHRKAVSVGVAKMSSDEMTADGRRGTAVKTRWIVEESSEPADGRPASWDDTIAANRHVLDSRTAEAVKFIQRTAAENDLPVAVSYSGGKDSLATLLLVLEAGLRPSLMFVDTGLEFPETVDNVHRVAEKHSLDLVVEEAGDAFWKNLEHFGPPAKDFRWCCKTCKLGPATRLIQENFPDGVLSFIGQRAYESESRARKGSVWRNPWTPNQLGASPIQKWTALHVWLFLFDRDAEYNPLYENGFERIGCFLCPSTDLAEFRETSGRTSDFTRWQEYLRERARSEGLPDEWLRYDLWRWKRPPKSVLDVLGIEAPRPTSSVGGNAPDQPLAKLELRCTEGYSPCVNGVSMEGVFSRPLDMDRVANLLNMVGEVVVSPDGRIAESDGVTVFAEGPVMAKAADEDSLKAKVEMLREVVVRAMDCAGCGICVARCPTGALSLDGRLRIDEDRCTHCGKCLGPCPVVAFREDQLDI